MYILALESSCDDTSVAIIDDEQNILSNIVSSNLEIHKKYGGVIPEEAARNHEEIIDDIVKAAFKEANLNFKDIDLIAATAGPGLIGGVVISLTYAKTLAAILNKPFIAVNHLTGHALTPRLIHKELQYPFLNMLASGGHSFICECKENYEFNIYGETLDDSFGEAFDKVAKLLSLPYPGGPEIEKRALEGDESKYELPIPLRDNQIRFSLSGLKTAVRSLVAEIDELSDEVINDIAASFQNVVAKHICQKLQLAIKQFKEDNPDIGQYNLVFTGGVAANLYLRNKIEKLANDNGFNALFVPIKLCTDNAAMIAWSALEKYKNCGADSLDFKPRPRWPINYSKENL